MNTRIKRFRDLGIACRAIVLKARRREELRDSGIVLSLIFLFAGCATMGPNQSLTIWTAEITVQATADQPVNIDVSMPIAAGGIPDKVGIGTVMKSGDIIQSRGNGIRVVNNGRVEDVRIVLDGYYTQDGSDNSSAHGIKASINTDGSWLNSVLRGPTVPDVPPFVVEKQK